MNLRRGTIIAVGLVGAGLCCVANYYFILERGRNDVHACDRDAPVDNTPPTAIGSMPDLNRTRIRNDEFLPDSLRKKYTSPQSIGPDQKIVVNLGMPRTGTNTWIEMMKRLHPHPQRGEYHRIFERYAPEDLTELLLMGNRSTPANPLHRALTSLPEGTAVRALADHPSFLLAPIARDYPHVYFVQVTRDLEAHVNSTLYMLGKWCLDRCACNDAPRCTTGNMAIVDRLYFDRFHALGHLCENHGNAARIPRELMRTWLRTHEEETTRYMRGHPRYLRLRLEDGPEVNLGRMVDFMGLDASVLEAMDFGSFHANKRGT